MELHKKYQKDTHTKVCTFLLVFQWTIKVCRFYCHPVRWLSHCIALDCIREKYGLAIGDISQLSARIWSHLTNNFKCQIRHCDYQPSSERQGKYFRSVLSCRFGNCSSRRLMMHFRRRPFFTLQASSIILFIGFVYGFTDINQVWLMILFAVKTECNSEPFFFEVDCQSGETCQNRYHISPRVATSMWTTTNKRKKIAFRTGNLLLTSNLYFPNVLNGKQALLDGKVYFVIKWKWKWNTHGCNHLLSHSPTNPE